MDNKGLRSFFIAVMSASLILGFWGIRRGIPANASEPAPDRTLTAVTLNLAKEGNPDRVVHAIESAPRLQEADLFLLQEVVHGPGGLGIAEETARRLGYHVSFAAAPGFQDQGLALVSRYPIGDVQITPLKTYDLGFRSRSRFAIAGTIQTPWGPLRVWNVHLDTRINAGERLEQLQPVIHEASGHGGPALIGGDFNTNDIYWLRNLAPLPVGPSHSEAIRAAMRQHGFDTPLSSGLNTYPAFFRHLDWVFMRTLDTLSVSLEPAPFSDHHAIWVRVRL